MGHSSLLSGALSQTWGGNFMPRGEGSLASVPNTKTIVDASPAVGGYPKTLGEYNHTFGEHTPKSGVDTKTFSYNTQTSVSCSGSLGTVTNDFVICYETSFIHSQCLAMQSQTFFIQSHSNTGNHFPQYLALQSAISNAECHCSDNAAASNGAALGLHSTKINHCCGCVTNNAATTIL